MATLKQFSEAGYVSLLVVSTCRPFRGCPLRLFGRVRRFGVGLRVSLLPISYESLPVVADEFHKDFS